MENKAFTTENVSAIPHELLVQLYIQNLEKLDAQTAEIKKLTARLDRLMEQILLMNQRQYGRQSEQASVINGQYRIDLATGEVIDPLQAPDVQEVEQPKQDTSNEPVSKRKRNDKRSKDGFMYNCETINHPTVELSEEELREMFPNGYTRLENETYRTIEFKPAHIEVHQFSNAVYKAKKTGEIKRSEQYRNTLIAGSPVTPSLLAGLADQRYGLLLPANRISDHFQRNGIEISKQNIYNWTKLTVDRFMLPLYEYLKLQLLQSKLIHADETPLKIRNKADKDAAGDKAYMWVYHTRQRYGSPAIYVYEYHDGRKAKYLEEILNGYEGILVTDGYQVYHTFAKRSNGKVKISGCYVHAKRKYAELVKTGQKGGFADEMVARIQGIFLKDKEKDSLPLEEQLAFRREYVKPLVDAYFARVHEFMEAAAEGAVDKGSKLFAAVQYSYNQEEFLRTFLDDPMIPLDNNLAEISIKSYCVAKHAWHIKDTAEGAINDAVMHSIVETLKANHINCFEYIKYYITKCHEQGENNLTTEFIESVSPWSKSLPVACYINKQG